MNFEWRARNVHIGRGEVMEDAMLAGKRILTVDDSAAIRVFLVQLLSEHGAELDEAASGAQTIALFDAGKRCRSRRLRPTVCQTTKLEVAVLGGMKAASSREVRAAGSGDILAGPPR